MEEHRKKANEDIERDVIFSHAIKAGKRIYYMDVRKTRKDEMYLSITESKKIVSGEGNDAQVSFEKHKIFLYREDFSNFIDGLTKTVRFIQKTEEANGKQDADNGALAQSDLSESGSAQSTLNDKTEVFNIEF